MKKTPSDHTAPSPLTVAAGVRAHQQATAAASGRPDRRTQRTRRHRRHRRNRDDRCGRRRRRRVGHGCAGVGAVVGGARRGGHVRHPGWRDPPGVRSDLRLGRAAHSGPARAGRRPRRDRVRPGDRQGGRVHRDVRSRRDEPRDADRRRVHGLRADRGDHGAGAAGRDRVGRLPGGGHPRDHASDHEAQLPGAVSSRRGPGHGGGVPPRLDRPPGSRARRHPEGRAPGSDRVLLAADDGTARLPADAATARQADP